MNFANIYIRNVRGYIWTSPLDIQVLQVSTKKWFIYILIDFCCVKQSHIVLVTLEFCSSKKIYTYILRKKHPKNDIWIIDD